MVVAAAAAAGEVVYEAVSRVAGASAQRCGARVGKRAPRGAGSLPQSVDEFAHLRLDDVGDDDDDDDDSDDAARRAGAAATTTTTAAAATAAGGGRNDVRYFLDANARSVFAADIAQVSVGRRALTSFSVGSDTTCARARTPSGCSAG